MAPARARTHISAALVERRRLIGARSLPPGRSRALAETRALQGLEAGHRGACERLARTLLEDQPQALQRRLRLALHPAAHSEALLERLARGPRLVPVGRLDPGQARARSRQLPRHATSGTQVAPPVCTLDDPA